MLKQQRELGATRELQPSDDLRGTDGPLRDGMVLGPDRAQLYFSKQQVDDHHNAVKRDLRIARHAKLPAPARDGLRMKK